MPLAVFLVEDNEKIRDHLIPALADLGDANVLAIAQSEGEAVQWLAGHKGEWDLAVVDLFLAEGSGIEVVRWCQGRETHQRVAVLTNYSTESVRKLCFDAGADAFFDKSTQLDEFFEFCLQANRPPLTEAAIDGRLPEKKSAADREGGSRC
ncbi:response regulator [Variovorax sp. J22P271]|uniref:response regulator n=1 Tax=Variovorax davisae TaxID=3053515 RepID=UPI00257523CE|nr:response regulator [Variovorax sp. J22P271]MDM0032269.1 response regulator [Variovorax sp. J22P271]